MQKTKIETQNSNPELRISKSMETKIKTHFFVAHSKEKNQLTSDKIPQEWMTSTPASCTLICTHMNEAFHRNRGASRPDIWELGSAGGETKTPKTSKDANSKRRREEWKAIQHETHTDNYVQITNDAPHFEGHNLLISPFTLFNCRLSLAAVSFLNRVRSYCTVLGEAAVRHAAEIIGWGPIFGLFPPLNLTLA